MDKSWFDLRPVIKRTYAQSVWIPLEIAENDRVGEYGDTDFRELYEGVHAIAVPLEKRVLGERYSWSDSNEPRPWAEPGFYRPVDIYGINQETEVGIRLVLRQRVPDQSVDTWHLHQDFVIALELLREGDSWLRPAEGYVEVARVRRNKRGDISGIEAKAEFLRDYLCGRDSALRIASYRERTAIIEELGDIDFARDAEAVDIFNGKLEERAWAIDSSGSPFGAGVAVFRMSRTDVDPDDDVPIMGPETADNVESSSRRFTREDGKRFRVIAEFWRDEWIEPALNSPRVRSDHIPSQVTFVIEPDGTQANADDLNDEDIGRWLWFIPTIVKPDSRGRFPRGR